LIAKIGIDELVWTPFWNALYLLSLGVMKREDFGKIRNQIRELSGPLLIAGLKFWVPVDILTFGVIPKAFRLLWVDIIEIIWCIILSKTSAN
jgi:hypothetical protein